METVRPGPGEPLLLFVSGKGLTDATGFVVTDSVNGTNYNECLKVITTEVQNGVIEVRLPSSVKRYINVTLEGPPTAGTWTCGVVLPGVQTAK